MFKFISFAFFLSALSSIVSAQNILISEDFESSDFPEGWSQQTLASDGGWLLGTAGALQSEWWSIADHGNIIGTNDDACDCDKSEDYLIMPPLDLSTISNAILQFQAYYDGETFEGSTEVATIEYSLDDPLSDEGGDALAESSDSTGAGEGDIEGKLDLARAYVEIGDQAAAIELLDEIDQQGTIAQKEVADVMRKELTA